MFQRVNLLSGPCGTKSTQVYGLMYLAKKNKHKAEFVREVVKDKAYSGDKFIVCSEQLSLISQQIYLEELYLNCGADYIISESPTFLPLLYAEIYKKDTYLEAMKIAFDIHEKKYPSLNFWLKRELNKDNYVQAGRFQTLDEAIMVHNTIYKAAKNTFSNLIEVRFDDIDEMFKIIKENVKIY